MPSASSAATAAAALVLAIIAAVDAPAGEHAARVLLLVQSSPLAGVRYHEALALWEHLRVGEPLELLREPDNPYDSNAVRVEWRGRRLGYVPRRENAALAWALDRGMPLRARISALESHPNPARRIRFEVVLD